MNSQGLLCTIEKSVFETISHDLINRIAHLEWFFTWIEIQMYHLYHSHDWPISHVYDNIIMICSISGCRLQAICSLQSILSDKSHFSSSFTSSLAISAGVIFFFNESA